MSAPATSGSVILVNGASSAGKSTLCRALRDALPGPFLHFSLDLFMFGDTVLPRTPDGKIRDWPTLRPRVFEGFYRCLPALLTAGNSLVVDLIIETAEQRDRLWTLLAPHDVYVVGLRCPVEELERRERARGDRRPGDARRDAETVHAFMPYELELDCTAPLPENMTRVIEGWRGRTGVRGGGPASAP
ncbi:phosphotransferase-like protein [Deinococcus aerophilus]|nr:AAA family ATPase [Deinococcus aerophilus]